MSNKRVLKTNEPDVDYSTPVYFKDYYNALSEVVRIRKYVHKKRQKLLSQYCGVGMNTIIRFESADPKKDPYINYELLMKYFLYFSLELKLHVEPISASKENGKKQAGGEGDIW
jgi:hypothetical protein